MLVDISERLSLLGGPPSETPLSDAVARGIAGVLLAERFEAVVTDLGAGAELARVAVGGVLNPADVCVVLADGTYLAERASERVAEACRLRGVAAMRIKSRRGAAEAIADEIAHYLRSSLTPSKSEA